ncbi:hypothetical protein KP509_33G052000 [Ceratopteris richardii]|uniref:Uncharacterized protein n=1 Tax=Ceratopteris richardii TaxID=49495 RepID=A0A8T2QRE6_CERRI|nr:hypothetical protein KP509_33G052000 [Ceratopteris richardii]
MTSSIGAVAMDPQRDPDVVVDESCWSNLDYCKETKLLLLTKAVGATKKRRYAWPSFAKKKRRYYCNEETKVLLQRNEGAPMKSNQSLNHIGCRVHFLEEEPARYSNQLTREECDSMNLQERNAYLLFIQISTYR